MIRNLCLCVAMLLIILTGCHQVDHSDVNTPALTISNENTSNEDAPNNSGITESEYVIYATSCTGDIVGFANTETVVDNVSFGSLSERDFSYSRRNNFTHEDVEVQKSFPLGNLNLTATYSRSFSNSLANSSDKNLHKLGWYDEYRCEENGNEFTVRFRQEDGELAFFASYDERDVTGTLTEQDAKLLADAYLIEEYGEQFFAEYPNCSIVVTDRVNEKIISVCYTKYVCGYPTTDRVIVTYNMNGALKSFNGMTKGLFDSVACDITTEKIDNAEKVLINAIPETWEIGSKKLALDADGGCYLYMTASSISENTDSIHEALAAMEFYINLA